MKTEMNGNKSKKDPWTRLTGLGLAAMLTAPLALSGFAQAGTGVGGGSPSARDQYLAALAAQMGPHVQVPSAAAPLGNVVSQWCSRIGAVLRHEQVRARNQFAQNQKEQAKQTFIDAMVAAAQSIQIGTEPASPITKTLLDRGLILSQAMDDTFAGGDVQSLTTEVNFLDQYVSFVLRTQTELDLPYYVPYVYHYGSCGGPRIACPSGFNIAEFERRYLSFAREQLRFSYLHLTEIGAGEDGVSHVFPVGDGRAFLKVAEFESNWVAQDLAQNLFAAQEACVAQDLSQLSSEVTMYFAGDRSVFGSEPIAVYEVRTELEAFSERVPHAGCAAVTPEYPQYPSYPANPGYPPYSPVSGSSGDGESTPN